MKTLRRVIKDSAKEIGGRKQDKYVDTGWLQGVIDERYKSNALCAQEMGVTTTTLSRLINGLAIWSPEQMAAFQKATGRSAEELLSHLTRDGWNRRNRRQ